MGRHLLGLIFSITYYFCLITGKSFIMIPILKQVKISTRDVHENLFLTHMNNVNRMC